MGNAVRAAGWIVLLADKGLINAVLIYLGVLADPVRILYTGNAVAIGLIAVLLPFMIISLQAVFDGVSESYEEAALSLGARPFTMFRRVLLPLIMPGIFSGCLLCFVLAMNAYATPVLIGGPSFHMMAPKVYEQALKVFQSVDLTFTSVSVMLGDLSDEQIKASEQTLHSQLGELEKALNSVNAIVVADSKGQRLVSSAVFPVTADLGVEDRDYYLA